MIDVISEKTNRANPETEMIINKPTYDLYDKVIVDAPEPPITQEGKEFNRLGSLPGVVTVAKYSFALKEWYYDVKLTAHCYIIDVEEQALNKK